MLHDLISRAPQMAARATFFEDTSCMYASEYGFSTYIKVLFLVLSSDSEF